jgi:hypothetical protein
VTDPTAWLASVVAVLATVVGAVLALDRARMRGAVRRHDDARKLDEIYQHFAQPEPDEDRVNLPTQVRIISAEMARAVGLAEDANEIAHETRTELREHVLHEDGESQKRTTAMDGLTAELAGLRSDVKELSDGR